MSNEPRPVNVNILDKEYLIACDQEEREKLHSAVNLLNSKIQEVRASGKVIGTERIAVMAALDIAHELLAYKHKNEYYISEVRAGIERLSSKIDRALCRGRRDSAR